MNRALSLVAEWVGQGVALALSSLRRPRAAEVAALRERLEKLRAENEILRSRLARIEPHARPRYRAWERLQILLHRARYGMSVEATARAFLGTGQTVINWLGEVESGVARLVRSRRPMNALPDLVRKIALFLKREWPSWGTRRIAGILGRLGLRASRTSVQRLLRRPCLRRPPAAAQGGRPSPLRARFPRQVFVLDFTYVRIFFRTIVVGAVLDAFSRKILALRVWTAEPDAAETCLLLRHALRRHGKPRWVVSDKGRQFRSARFREFLARRRIGRRFAAVGDANLARIDRFWRSLKDEYAGGLLLFRPIRTLERQVRLYAGWHNASRPHQGLGLRTPHEVDAGRAARRRFPIQPARLEVRLLDGERALPLFRLRPSA